jgi:hypothetical protein
MFDELCNEVSGAYSGRPSAIEFWAIFALSMIYDWKVETSGGKHSI